MKKRLQAHWPRPVKEPAHHHGEAGQGEEGGGVPEGIDYPQHCSTHLCRHSWKLQVPTLKGFSHTLKQENYLLPIHCTLIDAFAHFSGFIPLFTPRFETTFFHNWYGALEILSFFRQMRSNTELRKRRAAEVDDENTYRFEFIEFVHSLRSEK